MLETHATRLIDEEVECELSDGVVLRADVVRPAHDEPVPVLLVRTPYSKAGLRSQPQFDIHRAAEAGFAVVVQDVRGRFRSDGEFTPSVNEASDGAEVVAWVAAQEWCNGSVGMWGASYLAEVQWSAKSAGAPALVSMAPALSPAHSTFDGFRFRGGAREVGSMLGWSLATGSDLIARMGEPERSDAERVHDRIDQMYDDGTLFRAASWSAIPSGDPMVDWMLGQLAEPYESPDHDLQKMAGSYDAIDVPVLLIGGWFDVFLGSTLGHYRALRQKELRGDGATVRLIVGPWSHVNGSGRIGDCDYGTAASFADIAGRGDYTDLHLRWFDATLRGGGSTEAAVMLFDTGSHQWVEFNEFPPPATRIPFHFSEHGRLDQVPSDRTSRVDLVADPADPVPTIGGPTLLLPPFDAGPFDQRVLYGRDDVISFRTDPLDDPLTVCGQIVADVDFSTSGLDADIVVRLCDEGPDGASISVCDGILRLSARDIDPETGKGEPYVVVPGTFNVFRVDLWAAAHTFATGHRVRVDVTWSSSPRWDINRHHNAHPFEQVRARPATHTVGLGGPRGSRILLPVLGPQRES